MNSSMFDISLPSPKQDGEYPIPVSPEVAAPILLKLIAQ